VELVEARCEYVILLREAMTIELQGRPDVLMA
jgi:hypothetical protein